MTLCASRRHARHGHGVTGARGVASRRREVMRRTRRRYQITNNHYQSTNVTAGLSCQRDADAHVTDTAARVRRGVATRRHEVRRRTRRRYQITNNRYQITNVTLGVSCQRDADTHVTDTAARVRQGAATRRHEVRRRTRCRYQITNNRYQSATMMAWLWKSELTRSLSVVTIL